MTKWQSCSIFSALFMAVALFFSSNVMADNQLVPYHQYPAAVYSGANAAVNFASNSKAKAFKSHLLTAAKHKPDFAGHYVLTSWGCGAFCTTMAVLDVKTGNVYFPDPFKNNPDWSNRLIGYTFEKPQVNSRLLVIKAQLTKLPRNTPGALSGPKIQQTLYFQWQNNKLVLLRKISELMTIQ